MSTYTIGNVVLNAPYMNAACSIAKTPEDIKALCQTSAGAVLIGSITRLARDGNAEPRWFDGDTYALNSFGMPNAGADYYTSTLPGLTTTIHESGKAAILSIAGFSVDDYAALARLADTSGVDLLELNFGCPNIRTDGAQKPIASFDINYMQAIVEAVAERTSLPLLLKLSPYSNPHELLAVAEAIAAMPNTAGVVTMNTFANAYHEIDGQPVLAMEYGGLSGRSLQPIALGQVRQFRNALPETIAVIGVGGIETTDDVRVFIAAGATAVQAATIIVRDGHAALERLAL